MSVEKTARRVLTALTRARDAIASVGEVADVVAPAETRWVIVAVAANRDIVHFLVVGDACDFDRVEAAGWWAMLVEACDDGDRCTSAEVGEFLNDAVAHADVVAFELVECDGEVAEHVRERISLV